MYCLPSPSVRGDQTYDKLRSVMRSIATNWTTGLDGGHLTATVFTGNYLRRHDGDLIDLSEARLASRIVIIETGARARADRLGTKQICTWI